MTTQRQLPQRKSPRLQGYDYAQAGAYFVTICTHLREYWFGEVLEGEIFLTEIGIIAAECWTTLPEHFPQIELDHFVVMPNHIHGIVLTTDQQTPDPLPLGKVVNTYKGAVTRIVRRLSEYQHIRLWQSRYHDHIIRNDVDLNRIREYVLHNPSRWAEDIFYGD